MNTIVLRGFLDSIVIICVSILVVLSLCFMLMSELGIPDLFSCDVCLAIVLLVYHQQNSENPYVTDD